MRLQELLPADSKGSVFAYAPHAAEVDVLGIAAATRRDKIYLPVVTKVQGELEFFPWQQGAPLNPGRFGIGEPQRIGAATQPGAGDFILIPGIAVDRQGYRLGYGGGYYDRLLQNCKATKIAVVYPSLFVSELPHEPHDQKVDIIVTAETMFRP